MNERLTLKKMADEIGIHYMTVSNVINNHGVKRGYSQKTIKRVQDHLQARGFVPSRKAVNLKQGVQERIGIFHSGPLYSHLKDAYDNLSKLYNENLAGLELMYVRSKNRLSGIQEMLARGVTKLIWIHTYKPSHEFGDPIIYNYLSRFEKVIIYNYKFKAGDNSHELEPREFHLAGFHLVGFDRYAGFRMVGNLLKELGHEKIGIADAGQSLSKNMDAVRSLGLTPVSLFQSSDNYKYKQGKMDDFSGKILQGMKHEGITCATFMEDTSAAVTMRALQKTGVSIPEDISIIGYDGMAFCEYLQPSLTTLSAPVEPMVEQVKKIMDGSLKKPINCFDMKLVLGESHGPVPISN